MDTMRDLARLEMKLVSVTRAMRLVRFLYMMRWPHSRQRIGSRARISFVAEQSVSCYAPAQMYSTAGCRALIPGAPAGRAAKLIAMVEWQKIDA